MNYAAYQPVSPMTPSILPTSDARPATSTAVTSVSGRHASPQAISWPGTRLKNFVRDQIDLCTGCHTMTTNDGVLIGSGNTLSITADSNHHVDVPTAPFYHNTRMLPHTALTHYAHLVLRSYRRSDRRIHIRKVTRYSRSHVFDCHGHEYKTNTRALAKRPERRRVRSLLSGGNRPMPETMDQKVAALGG